MSGDFHERQGATAAIGAALADRGWKLIGYKEDKSDGMTDYFDPASWDGIARRDGLLLLCDVWKYHAGQYAKPQPIYGRADGPCSACKGTGKVQHESPEYVSVSIFGGARHVDPARHVGEVCEHCEGTGRREEHGRIVGELPAVPHVRACPGRWIVIREADGKILGTGQRPLKADRMDHEGGSAAVARVVGSIEEAAGKATPTTPTAAAPTDVDVGGATVRPSTVRDGFVEVVHPERPEQPIIDELKAAGFRWALRSRCWYGPAKQLPTRYAQPTTEAVAS
jgi:hypothetical protein